MLGEFSDEKDLKIAELTLRLEKMSVGWAGEVEIMNNRWVEDNEQNEVIIDALKEEVEKLQDCNYEEYISIVCENKLIKEFVDLKNECGELKKEAEVREDWIHNVMRCLEVYEEWEGAGGDETADDLADRVARENKKLKEEKRALYKRLRETREKPYTIEEEYWRESGYSSFEEAIVADYGDQSEQAKKYGFGVFKKVIGSP